MASVVSQIRVVLSIEQVPRSLSSEENAMAFIKSVWPSSLSTLLRHELSILGGFNSHDGMQGLKFVLVILISGAKASAEEYN